MSEHAETTPYPPGHKPIHQGPCDSNGPKECFGCKMKSLQWLIPRYMRAENADFQDQHRAEITPLLNADKEGVYERKR